MRFSKRETLPAQVPIILKRSLADERVVFPQRTALVVTASVNVLTHGSTESPVIFFLVFFSSTLMPLGFVSKMNIYIIYIFTLF